MVATDNYPMAYEKSAKFNIVSQTDLLNIILLGKEGLEDRNSGEILLSASVCGRNLILKRGLKFIKWVQILSLKKASLHKIYFLL